MKPKNLRTGATPHRQAVVASVKADLKRAERRRKLWFYGSGAAIIFAAALTVTLVIVSGQTGSTPIATGPIRGVVSSEGLGRNHVVNKVAFPAAPPVGGDHSEQLTNCGIYPDPVDTWRAVHSLEHGAVWVTYRPDLPADERDMLAAQAADNDYELLSPYPDLPAPVVVSAWGKQLSLQSAADPRLAQFLATYLQGPQTPEPGAPCSGGVDG